MWGIIGVTLGFGHCRGRPATPSPHSEQTSSSIRNETASIVDQLSRSRRSLRSVVPAPIHAKLSMFLFSGLNKIYEARTLL